MRHRATNFLKVALGPKVQNESHLVAVISDFVQVCNLWPLLCNFMSPIHGWGVSPKTSSTLVVFVVAVYTLYTLHSHSHLCCEASECPALCTRPMASLNSMDALNRANGVSPKPGALCRGPMVSPHGAVHFAQG